MNKINEFFKKFNGIIMILLIGSILLLLFTKHSGVDNNRPYDDSLYIYKNKIGQLQYEKEVERMSKNDLKKENEKMYEIYKSFAGNKPNIIMNLKVVNVDTVKTASANTYKYEGNDKHSLSWSFKGKSYELDGKSMFRMKLDSSDKKNIRPIFYPDSSYLTRRRFELELNAGLVQSGNKKKIIITPVDTNFKVNILDVIEIEDKYNKPPKKPVLSLGFQMGYGITSINNQFHHSPYIGLGINYNLLTIYSKEKKFKN